jgi:hypothetical protein
MRRIVVQSQPRQAVLETLSKKKKKIRKKRPDGVAQGAGSEFKPQYCNKQVSETYGKKKKKRQQCTYSFSGLLTILIVLT